MVNKEKIDELLNSDSLGIAEKITGKSYKEDDKTGNLGMLINIGLSEEKKKLLSEANDTCFSETTENYMRLVLEAGFELLLEEDFSYKCKYSGALYKEKFFIMFHREYSILLKWDTFQGKRNAADMYYNWAFDINAKKWSFTSSGHCIHEEGFENFQDFTIQFDENFNFYEISKELRDSQPRWGNKGENSYENYEDFKVKDDEWYAKVNETLKGVKLFHIWCGNHDAREAIKHKINGLAENGVFLKKWKEQPFLWLLHHGDTKDEKYDYNALNAKRISKLPLDIQEIIKGK